jgi:predicted transcriptional regulator
MEDMCMNNNEMANKLRQLRESEGLAVKDVIDMLCGRGIKISPKTLYSWEVGRAQPDADTFMMLCDIYMVEDILTEFGYLNDKANTQTHFNHALVNKVSRLNERGLIALSAYADGLLTNREYLTELSGELSERA